MKLELCKNGKYGFSRTDLIVVVISIGSIALLLSLCLSTPIRKSKLNCQMQLALIGQDWRYYANTHDGRFGTLDASTLSNNAPRIERVYQTLGPRLSVSLLTCPKDSRMPASEWKILKNTNISYFFNADAAFNDHSSILAGDRNISISAQGVFSWNPALGLHGDHGNLVFADGHVEPNVISAQLDRFFHQGRNATNRLLVP
jgi:prepilin-type processing-associated H-X9-DG protein